MAARFIRYVVTLMLVPCLIVDPAVASTSIFLAARTPCLTARTDGSLFTQEAVVTSIVNAINPFSWFLRSRQNRELTSAPSPLKRVFLGRGWLGSFFFVAVLLGQNWSRPAVWADLARTEWRMQRYEALKDNGLSTEEIKIRSAVRSFVETNVKPIAVELDRHNKIERIQDLLVLMSQPMWPGGPSMVGASFPKEYGGADLGAVVESIITEELGRGSQSIALIHDVRTALTAGPLERFGTEEQKREFLIPLLNGEFFGAFAQTEENRGSDVAHLQTTATEDTDSYVINGKTKKQFITVGTLAKFAIVFARDPFLAPNSHGISAFIVPLDLPGVEVLHMESMAGHHGTGTSEITFRNVRIPKSNLLGMKNEGFDVSQQTLARGRISITSIIQSSLETTVEEVSMAYRERLINGMTKEEQKLWDETLTGFMADAYVARVMLKDAASKRDGQDKDLIPPAMAKLLSGERAVANAAKAIALVGPEALRVGSRLERNFRDTRLLTIGEGTTQIMRHAIKQMLTRGGKNFERAVIEWTMLLPDSEISAIAKLAQAHQYATNAIVLERLESRIIDLMAESLAGTLLKDEKGLAGKFKEAQKRHSYHLARQYVQEGDALVHAGALSPSLRTIDRTSELDSDSTDLLLKQVRRAISESSKGPHISPQKLLQELGTAQLLGAAIDWGEEGQAERNLVLGAVAEKDASSAVAMLEQEKVVAVIHQFGSDMDAHDLRALRTGRSLAAVAWRDGEQGVVATLHDPSNQAYSLRGMKSMVVNGGLAGTFLVIAEVKGHGPTAFLVQKGDTLTIKSGEILGLEGASVRDIEFDGTQGFLLGRVGQGQEILESMQTIETQALLSIAVGASRTMIHEGEVRARQRTIMWGRPAEARPIIERGQVRELLENAIDRVLEMPNQSVNVALSNTAQVSSDMLQIFGGIGYDTTMPINRYWCDLQALWVLYGKQNEKQEKPASSLPHAAFAMMPNTLAMKIFEFANHPRFPTFLAKEFLKALAYGVLAPLREAPHFYPIFADVWKDWDKLVAAHSRSNFESVRNVLLGITHEARLKRLEVFQARHTYVYVGKEKVDLNPEGKTSEQLERIKQIRRDLAQTHMKIFNAALSQVVIALQNRSGVEEATFMAHRMVKSHHSTLNREAPALGKPFAMMNVPPESTGIPSSKPAVTLTMEGEKAVITLQSQTLTQEYIDQLRAIAGQLHGDDTVKKVLITGVEGKNFCTGADLAKRLLMSRRETQDFLTHMNQAFDLIAALSEKKTTIAVLTGSAYGGGVELALACAYRIVVQAPAKAGAKQASGVLMFPEVRHGIPPGASGTQRAPRLIGNPAAADMILYASPKTEAEALKIGLVDKVIPAEANLDEAIDQMLIEKGPRSLAPSALSEEEDRVQELALTAHEFDFLKAFVSPEDQPGYRYYLQSTHGIDPIFYQSLQSTLEMVDFREPLSARERIELIAGALWPKAGDDTRMIDKALTLYSQLSSPDQVRERAAEFAKDPNVAPMGLAAAEMAVTQGLLFTTQRGQRLERLCYELTIPTEQRRQALEYFVATNTPAFSAMPKTLASAPKAVQRVESEAFAQAKARVAKFVAAARASHIDFARLSERLKRDPLIINELMLRDGFQNYDYFKNPSWYKTLQKRNYVPLLMDIFGKSGKHHRVEGGSSVAAQQIPANADFLLLAKDVVSYRSEHADASPEIGDLIFNKRGAEAVLKADPDVAEISINLSASEAYGLKNSKKTPLRSLNEDLLPAVEAIKVWAAKEKRPMPRLRCYVSCVWGYENEAPIELVKLAEFIALIHSKTGISEFALSDTTGLATPQQIYERFQDLQDLEIIRQIPGLTFVPHLHDTGHGILNVLASLQDPRVTIVDTSIANLGGSPSATDAPGNICTEDLLLVLRALGADTGIDLHRLLGVPRLLEAMTGEDLTMRQIFGLHTLTDEHVAELLQQVRVGLLGSSWITVKVKTNSKVRDFLGKGLLPEVLDVETTNPTVRGVLRGLGISDAWHDRLRVVVNGQPRSLDDYVADASHVELDVIEVPIFSIVNHAENEVNIDWFLRRLHTEGINGYRLEQIPFHNSVVEKAYWILANRIGNFGLANLLQRLVSAALPAIPEQRPPAVWNVIRTSSNAERLPAVISHSSDRGGIHLFWNEEEMNSKFYFMKAVGRLLRAFLIFTGENDSIASEYERYGIALAQSPFTDVSGVTPVKSDGMRNPRLLSRRSYREQFKLLATPAKLLSQITQIARLIGKDHMTPIVMHHQSYTSNSEYKSKERWYVNGELLLIPGEISEQFTAHRVESIEISPQLTGDPYLPDFTFVIEHLPGILVAMQSLTPGFQTYLPVFEVGSIRIIGVPEAREHIRLVVQSALVEDPSLPQTLLHKSDFMEESVSRIYTGLPEQTGAIPLPFIHNLWVKIRAFFSGKASFLSINTRAA